MPKNGAQARAELTDRNKNPTRSVAGPTTYNGGGQVVFVSLVFQRPYTPEDVFDALETKFGAGKVVSDLDTMAQGQMQFRILP